MPDRSWQSLAFGRIAVSVSPNDRFTIDTKDSLDVHQKVSPEDEESCVMCFESVLRKSAGRTGMMVVAIIGMITPTPVWADWSYGSEVVVSGSNGGSSGGWHSSYGSNGGSSGGSSGRSSGGSSGGSYGSSGGSYGSSGGSHGGRRATRRASRRARRHGSSGGSSGGSYGSTGGSYGSSGG